MSLDVLYQVSTFGMLPPWIILIFAPRWRYTQIIVQSVWIPLVLGLLYAWLIFSNEPNPNVNPMTLEGAKYMFESQKGFLAGWIHYVIFDLFVAAWIVRDSIKHGIKHLWIVPCLLFALVLGPVGLLLYSILRLAKTKEYSILD